MKHLKNLALAAAFSSALFLTACSDEAGKHEGPDHSGPEHGDTKPATESGKATDEHAGHDMTKMGGQATAKPYPLDTCVVSGEKLDSMGEPKVLVHEGQQIKFCCNDCVTEFKAEPAKFFAKLNEAVAKAAK